MDIVFIEQLSVITTIGVYDWEQTIEQKLVFDIEIAWDNRKAAASDDVSDCLSYADISDGGSSSYTGATQKRANIHAGAWSDGSFTISNSTIGNSAAWGIWVTLGSPDITIPASVTYSNNASGNYYKE